MKRYDIRDGDTTTAGGRVKGSGRADPIDGVPVGGSRYSCPGSNGRLPREQDGQRKNGDALIRIPHFLRASASSSSVRSAATSVTGSVFFHCAFGTSTDHSVLAVSRKNAATPT